MHILLKILLSLLTLSTFVLGRLVLSEPTEAHAYLSLIPLGSTVLLATIVFMLLAQPQAASRWLNLPSELNDEKLTGLGLKFGAAGLFLLAAWSFIVGAGLATLRM